MNNILIAIVVALIIYIMYPNFFTDVSDQVCVSKGWLPPGGEQFAEGTWEPQGIANILAPRKTPLIFPDRVILPPKDPKKELENIWTLYRGIKPNVVY